MERILNRTCVTKPPEQGAQGSERSRVECHNRKDAGTQKLREGDLVNMDPEDGVMLPPAKEPQTVGVQGKTLPLKLQRDPGPRDTLTKDFWPPEL
ncbi:unnamed protein product [Rangifer tarandus platyrhynchus]|uniref:Uncharacterized protein n=1 Tax=Rangifer tarandus platyrhynchus TaxID=3082113 RepID=A0AC59Z4P2_RANTA